MRVGALGVCLVLCALGCASPTLSRGRYQVAAAKVADFHTVHGEWRGPGAERVGLRIEWTRWLDQPEPAEARIHLTLSQHHPRKRWGSDARPAIVEGGAVRPLAEPRYDFGPAFEQVGGRLDVEGLRQLAGGRRYRPPGPLSAHCPTKAR